MKEVDLADQFGDDFIGDPLTMESIEHKDNETPSDKRLRLVKEKEELELLLESVEESLLNSGYYGEDQSQSTSSLQAGIQISGRLSFRGAEKAREYFRKYLDSDQDGFMTYEDFRGMIIYTKFTI